jgi:hypothetical protein
VNETFETDEDDWFPMLLARAWPVRELLDGETFDKWQGEKHLEDLMRGEGAVKVVYFKTVYDGLPQAYQGTGSIMAYYTARDMDGLYAWLNSEALRKGIEDGSQFFGKFNELDDSTYTGNVYVVSACEHVGSGTVPNEAPVFIERFETNAETEESFDEWLREVHLPHVASAPGVERVRTFDVVRENIPISYYLSLGNRMIAVELSDQERFREQLMSDVLLAALEDSRRWDLRLNYVRREVYRYANHAHSAHGGAH